MPDPGPLPMVLEQFLGYAWHFCQVVWGRVPTHVVLRWGPGDETSLPLAPPRAGAGLPGTPAAPGNSPPPGSSPEPFVPNVFQEAVLAALEGKALRTDALGAAAGDRGRLYKPGGLKELREHGWVAHHPRLGFYRPDAPPEELRVPE